MLQASIDAFWATATVLVEYIPFLIVFWVVFNIVGSLLFKD